MGVIRFPTERRLRAASPGRAETGRAAQALSAEEPVQAPGRPFALLSVEIRRLPRAGSRIDGEIAGRILSRCVLSCLEILSRERIPMDLSGTVLRPVVEATFPSEEGAARAARAGAAIREGVARVQREVEREFHVFGAIAVGSVSESESGVTMTSGAPEQVAARLREHAAPGQILLSETARLACEEDVEIREPAIPVTMPGSEPSPAYALAALKAPPE